MTAETEAATIVADRKAGASLGNGKITITWAEGARK